ncbi:MAG TPA: TonB-dependent receptor [Gemmatimonadaceae bacterium]|nr:TonB-dependent receptor [Gemmatimonadaceae bacterium]
MRNRTVAGLLALPVVALTAPLGAQEQARDTARTTPVIVTATRVPLSRGALPVAVTVITGDQLRLRGITTVADALNDLTSASVIQSGSQGAQTSLFLRGGESKYVKVLIDGVPANDPGGVYDFGSLTTDNVERIEIVRGPASVLYGADAVTGVVHVITRRGEGPQHVDISVRSGVAPRDRLASSDPDPGSLKTTDIVGGVSGSLASGAYSTAIGRHQSTGLYQLNNTYQSNVLSGRFSVSPAAGTELRFALRYTDSRFNYPTNGGGTPDSLSQFDRNAYRAEDRMVFGVEAERAFSSTLRAALSVNSSVNDGGTNDAVDAPGGNSNVSQDKIRRRGAELRVQLLPVTSTTLTLGAQIEQQDQRSQTQAAFGTFTFNSLFNASRRNEAAYIEAVVAPIDRLTATVGARYDDNEAFGTFNTGRLGVSWRALADTRLRATAGTAFREPTFTENYASGFVTGNPNLAPERTRSFDVGVEQGFLEGRVQASVTAFAQRFRNMIDYTGDTTSCGFSYCNVAEATSNGVELEGQARVAGPFWASVAATALRTRVVTPGFDSTSGGLYHKGESLIRRPQRKYDAELSYRGTGKLSATARWLHVGIRTDRDFRPFPARVVRLRGYDRIDIGADYTVRPGSSITLRVENLQNTGYQNAFNFLAPRRTVVVGARASR